MQRKLFSPERDKLNLIKKDLVRIIRIRSLKKMKYFCLSLLSKYFNISKLDNVNFLAIASQIMLSVIDKIIASLKDTKT